jgi:hypothetical protein
MKIKLNLLIASIFLVTSCGDEELTSSSFEIFNKAIELNPVREEAGKASLVKEKGEVLHYFKGEPYTGWIKMTVDPNWDTSIPVPEIIYKVVDGRQNGQSLKNRWKKTDIGGVPQPVEYGNWKDGLKHGEFREISYDPISTVTSLYDNGNFRKIIEDND